MPETYFIDCVRESVHIIYFQHHRRCEQTEAPTGAGAALRAFELVGHAASCKTPGLLSATKRNSIAYIFVFIVLYVFIYSFIYIVWRNSCGVVPQVVKFRGAMYIVRT